MKNLPVSGHKPEIERAPTVLHHDTDADDTLLARWLWTAMAKGPRFWLLALGTAVLAVALMFLVGALSAGNSAQSVAWDEMLRARTTAGTEKGAEELEKVADAYPKSPAAPWARLQAAGTRFNEAIAKLTTDPTTARPLLKKALDEFQEVVDAAPRDKDAPQARFASLGMARTLEARNELKDAIEQYRRVASTWPGTEEAKLAARQADLLAKPESVEFYKQLSEYKPPEKTIPPGGTGIFDGGLPPGHPSINLPPTTRPAPAGGTDPSFLDLPSLIPDITPKDAPAGGSKPADAPKPADDLPSDPFAPRD